MTTPKTRQTILLPEKEVSAALDMLTDNSIGPAEVITLTEEWETGPVLDVHTPESPSGSLSRRRWVSQFVMPSMQEEAPHDS